MLKIFRTANLPVVQLSSAHALRDCHADFTDMSLWHNKIPTDVAGFKDKDLGLIAASYPVAGAGVALVPTG